MGRIFSPENLERHDRQAGDQLAASNRNRILEAVAERWNAFMRACRAPSVSRFSTLAGAMRFLHRGIEIAWTAIPLLDPQDEQKNCYAMVRPRRKGMSAADFRKGRYL